MRDPVKILLSIFIIVLLGYIAFNERRLAQLNKDDQANSDFVEYPVVQDEPIQAGKNVSISIPEKLSFSGEKVPLEIPDVMERLDRELHINSYWHNNSIFLIKRANRWLPQIEKVLAENNIPEDFKYLPAIESSFINNSSPRKAVGFWQLLEGTAKDFGLIINREIDERYNPVKSTEAACKYLHKAYEKFGNWTLAAASYDAGMRRIQNSLDEQQVSSYYDLQLNSETARYIFRILAAKELLTAPDKYGFEILSEHLYRWEPVKEIEVTETIPDLVEFAKSQGINLKILKRHNPWLRSNKLTVKNGEMFIISMPAG